MTNFLEEAKQLSGELVKWRRDLHRHPELGFQEVRTAGLVARTLTDLGIQVQTGVAKTGVIGLLHGQKPGPVVMLRFDMDALPVAEKNRTDYVSQVPGLMHACGHDGHVAIGLGVATLLARRRQELCGSVKVVFQPAEEGLGGALEMIRAGALKDPRPDIIFGLHLQNQMPSGYVAAGPGPVMAAHDRFHCTVMGKGGHGATPHQTVDALVTAAHIVVALQTVVSRNTDPSQLAVVSVGSLQAGKAFNVIAEQAELQGTVRTFDESTRQIVLRRVRQIAEGVASAMGAHVDVAIQEQDIALVNDGDAAARLREAAAQVVGPERVSADQRWVASEDMSYFLHEIGGCYFFLGAGRTESELPHHNPCFDFDESALPQGAAILCQVVASYLGCPNLRPGPAVA